MKYALAALPALAASALLAASMGLGCSKPPEKTVDKPPENKAQKPQTPAEICDQALAQSLVDDCTPSADDPKARNVSIRVGGERAYHLVIQQVPTAEALDKLQADNQREVEGAGLSPEKLKFYRDRSRRLLVTVASLERAAEAKEREEKFIKLIGPDS